MTKPDCERFPLTCALLAAWALGYPTKRIAFAARLDLTRQRMFGIPSIAS